VVRISCQQAFRLIRGVDHISIAVQLRDARPVTTYGVLGQMARRAMMTLGIGNEQRAEQDARANDHVWHSRGRAAWCASRGRGSSLTLGKSLDDCAPRFLSSSNHPRSGAW